MIYRSAIVIGVAIAIIIGIAWVIVSRCAHIFLHASSECSGSHEITSLAFEEVEIAAHMF